MMKVIRFFLFLFPFTLVHAQTTINKVNSLSFDNYAYNYNYTYWKENWKTGGAARNFINHTSKYALDIDFTNLNISSLLIDEGPSGRNAGFHALHTDLFANNYVGNIDYAILQNDTLLYEKSNAPTSNGNKDSQMAEYGVWRNTRFIGANHSNSAPLEPYFTGIEFSTWHDRLKMTYHVRPTTDILNGKLKLSVEIPAAYTQYYNTNDIHAFALPSDKGFAIKAGDLVDSMAVSGNLISIYSTEQDLLMNQSYEISLVFYAITSNLSTDYDTIYDQESPIQIIAAQTAPNATNITNISYDIDQGVHYVQLPRVNMGYFNCSLVDLQQRVDLTLSNSSNEIRRVRLCLFRQPNVNVTGFNSLICNANGDPSGLPLQISKNWHTSIAQLFSGSWINEYTELMIPANTTLNLQYKSTGAKWGETYSASSHQLCVAGAGVPRGGWLEAALGTFGESITHSPDYEYGNTNGADVRPFLVTNQAYGGTSSQCGWTGNVGGIDICVYQDATNARRYQSQVKTDFKKYSPNLTETSISALSSDQKLKLDYSFHLNRSDDYNRIYYKVKIKALDNLSFNRLDFFQLGGDVYNIHNTRQVVYGNDTGMVAQFLPTNSGSNNYTTTEIAMTGTDPWLWAGDGLNYNGASSGIDIDCNNGLIIRDYHAVFNGMPNDTPFVRERSSSIGFSASLGNNPTSYCMVPPAGIQSLTAGDSIEFVAEVVVLPKQLVDYYGPNQNFINALSNFGNTYGLFLREVKQNGVMASSPSNVIDPQYPLKVYALNDEAIVDIKGGVGYYPVVFRGLSEVDDPQLWLAEDSCWQLVDQSVHGKDFWQAEYDENTGTFDLVYNVNQDRINDSLAYTRYYLGDNPPSLQLDQLANLSGTIMADSSTITAVPGIDTLSFMPMTSYLGIPSADSAGTWTWTGPNGFNTNGRILDLGLVDSAELGQYILSYEAFGCSVSDTIHILPGVILNNNELSEPAIHIFPNPAKDKFSIQLPKLIKTRLQVFDSRGSLVYGTDIESTSLLQVNTSSWPAGNYTLHFSDRQSESTQQLIISGN